MTHRLAVRAVILQENRLLLVNAWPGDQSDLWCAPGGGADPHASLPDNLAREVHEECGLRIDVGPLCLVNEFHDPDRDFHQVEVFFRCRILDGQLDDAWRDPEGIVHRRGFFAQADLPSLRLKPDALRDLPWTDEVRYDALERVVR